MGEEIDMEIFDSDMSWEDDVVVKFGMSSEKNPY